MVFGSISVHGTIDLFIYERTTDAESIGILERHKLPSVWRLFLQLFQQESARPDQWLWYLGSQVALH